MDLRKLLKSVRLDAGLRWHMMRYILTSGKRRPARGTNDAMREVHVCARLNHDVNNAHYVPARELPEVALMGA